MKPYSSVEKPPEQAKETTESPAPYNWLLLLLIFIGYIIFAVLL